MRILLTVPNINRRNTLAAEFSMDQYDLKNLGQGPSNKICQIIFKLTQYGLMLCSVLITAQFGPSSQGISRTRTETSFVK